MIRSVLLTCTSAAVLVGCGGNGAESGTSAQTNPTGLTNDAASFQEETQMISPVEFRLSSIGLPTDGMWKCDPIFRDVNGDGHLDLLAIQRLGEGPRVWLGDGTGQWTESSEGLKMARQSCGGGIDVADVNGDGHMDLVVADHCGGIFVYLGDGTGKWTMVVEGLFPDPIIPNEQDHVIQIYRGAEDVAVGDINGNGFIDIVAGSADEGGINIYLGDGTGVNWEWVDRGLPTGKTWTNRLRLADLNGNGHLDIAAAHSDGPRVWLNDGNSFFEPAWQGMPTPMHGGLMQGVAVGDINNNGRLDIVIANWIDGPQVFLQNEDGSWEHIYNVFDEMWGGSQGIALADFDQDGNLDIVVTGRTTKDAGYVRGVYVLKGDGTGRNWKWLRESGLPETGLGGMSGIGVGDINGDGYPDLVVGSGLITEVDLDHDAAVIDPNLIVWTTHPKRN